MTAAKKANVRIREAMRRNDRAVLSAVRAENRAGRLYRTRGLESLAWLNARARLESSGKMRFVKRPAFGGWAIVGVSARGLE